MEGKESKMKLKEAFQQNKLPYNINDFIMLNNEGLKEVQKQNKGKDITPYTAWQIEKIDMGETSGKEEVVISSNFTQDPKVRLRHITAKIKLKHIVGQVDIKGRKI